MSEILDLPIIHTTHRPVFVIGAARSGTSVLTSLIRRYLKVSVGSESQFIIRFYRRLFEYGDLRSDDRLWRLIDGIAKERCFERWMVSCGFVLDRQRIFDRVAPGARGYPQVVNAIFDELARYQGMSRWGDKTLEYSHDLPVLLKLFPGARFVHIVRDGRDVALSALKASRGATNVYRAAQDWQRTLRRISHFASSLSWKQLLNLRYERLLSHPTETCLDLMDFLGIQRSEIVVAAIRADIRSQVRAGDIGKWRAGLSIAEQRVCEGVAGPQLRAAGYEPCHTAVHPLRKTERMYWEVHHVVRKALRPLAWVAGGR